MNKHYYYYYFTFFSKNGRLGDQLWVAYLGVSIVAPLTGNHTKGA
jgi:hypothetical protein